MLFLYAALLAVAGWLVMHTPTGFIPKMDRGIISVSLQLPQGASLQRTDEVVRRANQIVLDTPGVAHTSTLHRPIGFDDPTPATSGRFAIMLDDARARKGKGLTSTRSPTTSRASSTRSKNRKPRCSSPRPCAAWAAGRLLDAPAEPRQHDRRRVRDDRQRLHRRRQPAARHHERVHDLLGPHAAGLRRRRPRQGADAARAAGGDTSRPCASTWARPTSTTSTCSAAPSA